VNSFNCWRKAGVWKRILDAVSEAYAGEIQMIDSSSTRVHQHAANAKKKIADADGLPVTLYLSESQALDGHSAHLMLDTLAPGSILFTATSSNASSTHSITSQQLQRDTTSVTITSSLQSSSSPSEFGCEPMSR
jgi:hypothetical protein